MAGEDATVTEADMRAAQTVLDALHGVGVLGMASVPQALEARGVLASFAADVRWAGYLEGQQDGRRQVGRVVRDALEGEGL